MFSRKNTKKKRVEDEVHDEPTTHPPAHVTLMELPDGSTLRFGKGYTVALPVKPLDSLDDVGVTSLGHDLNRNRNRDIEGYFVHLGESQTRLPVPAPWSQSSDPVYVQDAHASALRFVTYGSMPTDGTLATASTEVIRLVLLSGSAEVGKTAMVKQLLESRFDGSTYFPTPELLWRETHLKIVQDRIPVLLRIADAPPTPTLSPESDLLQRCDCFMVLCSNEVPGSFESASALARVVSVACMERGRAVRERLRGAVAAIEEAEQENEEKQAKEKRGKKKKKKGKEKEKEDDPMTMLKKLSEDTTFGAPPIALCVTKIDCGNGPGPLIKSVEKLAKEINAVGVFQLNCGDENAVRAIVSGLCEESVYRRWRQTRAFNVATQLCKFIFQQFFSTSLDACMHIDHAIKRTTICDHLVKILLLPDKPSSSAVWFTVLLEAKDVRMVFSGKEKVKEREREGKFLFLLGYNWARIMDECGCLDSNISDVNVDVSSDSLTLMVSRVSKLFEELDDDMDMDNIPLAFSGDRNDDSELEIPHIPLTLSFWRVSVDFLKLISRFYSLFAVSGPGFDANARKMAATIDEKAFKTIIRPIIDDIDAAARKILDQHTLMSSDSESDVRNTEYGAAAGFLSNWSSLS